MLVSKGSCYMGFRSDMYAILVLIFTERMFNAMKKSVVLAEKPSVARDIARVLNCHKKGDGYLENDRYIVTWALGHLVTLADPESYDSKYETWKLEELPMIPPKLKLMTIKKLVNNSTLLKNS